MQFKIFFITHKDNHQLWLKTENIFALLPDQYKDCLERVNIINTSEDSSVIDDFGLTINPIGVVNESYMRLNPSAVNRYLTHFSIYNKIIKEDIDCCMVIEDEVDLSDLINILLLNPDFPDSADICNLSEKGIKEFNAYYITNQGAKKIVNLLLNTKWLNGIKRFGPADYELPDYFNFFQVFSSEPLQDFSCNNQIIAPIEKLVLTACQFQKIEFSGEISFIRANLNHKTFATSNDLKNFKEEDFQYSSRLIRQAFYINLKKDKSRNRRVKSMLKTLKLSCKRFDGISLTWEDVLIDPQLNSIQEKSMLVELNELFHENFSRDESRYTLGTLGCYMSHYKLLELIYQDFRNEKVVLIFEDDCFFNQKCIYLAENVINQLPSDWDILRSTWSATNKCSRVEYSNPLLKDYCDSMQDNISLRKDEIKRENPSVDPLIHALAGGTHFQLIKVSSIPKILEYLNSQPFLPIDCLYTTSALNVYDHKLNVSHDMFASSNINSPIETEEFPRYKLNAKEIITPKKIALLVSIFYTEYTEKIIEYINRLPFKCDIYLSCRIKTDYKKFSKKCNDFHRIIKVDYPDGGMDLHPFIDQLITIKKNQKKYNYYLKIHSKKDLNWAKSMFESVLPYANYERLFKNIDEYNVSGSDFYLFNFSNSHANKDLILKKINQFKLHITENDVWDKIQNEDSNKLDVDFYIKYHNDLRTSSLHRDNQNLLDKQLYKRHWQNHGYLENGRIPNQSQVADSAEKIFKFYAGTIFWFNQTYFNYLIENLDDLTDIKKHLISEKGYIKNAKTTYTHHLEYWFGLLASNLAYPKVLKGIDTITFLVPPIVEDTPRSGGLRTVFRMIGYLQKNNFNINIEICGEYTTTTEQQKHRIDLYNEIDDINSIELYFENEKTFANVYIATGWQTFHKTNYYKGKRRLVAFFCQDLEYEFDIVKFNQERKEYTKRFYEETIPTFTMSKFLANHFGDNRKIAATSLNVNTDTFYLDDSIKNGVCLFYDTCKKHRLPDLILQLSTELAKKYPTKKIYLYGDDEMFELEDQKIILLGSLKAEETAKLYRKCELGVVFSTTNPSRISYEMVACGTPAIEADCEYTQYDMNSDAFIRLKTDFDTIMNKIEELFSDPIEIKRLQSECAIYANENFQKNMEEQRFLQFLENVVQEKQTNFKHQKK